MSLSDNEDLSEIRHSTYIISSLQSNSIFCVTKMNVELLVFGVPGRLDAEPFTYTSSSTVRTIRNDRVGVLHTSDIRSLSSSSTILHKN